MLRTKFFVICAISLFLMPIISIGEQVKKNLPACVSEDLLDELTTYAGKGDSDGFRQLLISGQCKLLPVGASVSVVSPGFMVTTIRYRGVKLFTPAEAIGKTATLPKNPSSYQTKNIILELHDYKADKNPVRSIKANKLLVREVAKKVGKVKSTVAIALICEGDASNDFYSADDLYSSNGGRLNNRFIVSEATTLMDLCHQREDAITSR